MDNQTPISVLMPVLGPHPEFFLQAVRSILIQSHANLELLIVEDPSGSSAGELLKGLQDPRINHIKNHERTSLARQLNRGLNEARYELVARMDADDIAHPERLEKQLKFLNDNSRVDVVGSQLNIIDNEGNAVGSRRYPLTHDEIIKTMPIYSPLAHPTILYRRKAVLALGGYHERRTEDYDLWSRLAKAGARFANISEALLDYRIHPENFKTHRLRESILGTLEVKSEYWRNELGIRGRIRMLGERALLLLPPKLVLALFMKLYYRKRDS